MTQENKTDYSAIKPNPKAVAPQEQQTATQEAPKKLEPITSAGKPKKKGLAERFVAGLVGPHGIRSIGSSVNQNIIIPTVKKMVYDTFVAAASQAIFKDDRGVTSSRSGDAWNRPATRRGTNYNQQYRGQRRSRTSATSNGPVQEDNYGPVEVQQQIPYFVIPDRGDAVAVLNAMNQELHDFNQVSLAAYLQLLNQDTTYNDYSLGWTELADAYINPTRGGYAIELPQLEQIN